MYITLVEGFGVKWGFSVLQFNRALHNFIQSIHFAVEPYILESLRCQLCPSQKVIFLSSPQFRSSFFKAKYSNINNVWPRNWRKLMKCTIMYYHATSHQNGSLSPLPPCVPVTLSVTFLVSQAPLNRAVKIGIIWAVWFFRFATEYSGGHKRWLYFFRGA